MANPDANGQASSVVSARGIRREMLSGGAGTQVRSDGITDAARHRLPPVLSPQIEPRKIDEKPVLFCQLSLSALSYFRIIHPERAVTLSFPLS